MPDATKHQLPDRNLLVGSSCAAVARLSSDFEADIAAYEQVHLEILEMSDTLSMGIIRQFPSMFHHREAALH